MPEDFEFLWKDVNLIKKIYQWEWQIHLDYYNNMADRDLFCMYLMISI